MADIGKYYVQIIPSADGIGGKVEQAIAPHAKAAGVASGKTIAANIGSTMQSIGGGMMKAGAIATAVSVPIIAGIKSALSAYEVQTAAETKLTEIYKTRMGATKQAAQATMDYASALQKEGVIGDEVMLSGAQQVATFAKMPETVNTLLPAMNNLLAQQKGYNATAEDATGIANLMGKALMGQTGALTRVGISFDETQAAILKTGTEEEKAAVLAQVITENVGNMNQTLADTPLGKIQQMKNTFGDLKEQLGAQFAPVLQQIAEFVSAKILPAVQQVMNFMQANPIIAQITVGIAGLLAVGGPLLVIIGAMVSAVGAILPLLAGITAPMIGIAALIAAIGAALVTAYTQSAPFRDAVNSLASAIGSALLPVVNSAIALFKALIAEIVATVKSVANSLAPVIVALTPVLRKVASIVGGVLKRNFSMLTAVIRLVGTVVRTMAKIFSSAFMAVYTVINGAVSKFKSFASKVKDVLSFSGIAAKVRGVFNAVKDAIGNPIKTAAETVRGIVDRIKGFFHFSVPSPHIPMPHFSISPAGWKIGDLLKGSIPSLSVSWYAKGGIMNGPTLFGGGERGPEAIVPLDPFWKKLDKVGGSTFNVTMNVNGAEDPEAWADRFMSRLQMEARMA